MRRLRLSGSVLLAALALCLPPRAWAAATGWVGDDHAAARLITATDAVGSEAAVEAGLEIRLMHRAGTPIGASPGDAGIPPSIDWAGSANLEQPTSPGRRRRAIRCRALRPPATATTSSCRSR